MVGQEKEGVEAEEAGELSGRVTPFDENTFQWLFLRGRPDFLKRIYQHELISLQRVMGACRGGERKVLRDYVGHRKV